MKVKIFTFAFNRPDILQYQINSFKKHIEDDLEFHVVYDTRDNEYLETFTKICEDNQVCLHHHISQPGNTPSFYNSDAIQWTYDNFIKLDGEDFIAMILDHDIFLIEDFNVSQFMGGYDLSGLLQTRESVEYVWQGLIFFKKSSVENIDFNFYPQTVDGQPLDTCGGTYKLLRNENIKFKSTDVVYPDDYNGINLRDSSNSNGGYAMELHADQKFLHFRNACNWHNALKVVDNHKTSILYKILNDLNLIFLENNE
jgi:hypothetical protein